MKNSWVLSISLVLTSFASVSHAGKYPDHPIRIIVPSAPGSGADNAARFFGQQLTTMLGQSFVVENKPGASGAIGARTVKSAPADGYTIFLGSNTPLVVSPLLVKNLPYDPVKDFKPLSGTTRGMNMISTSAQSDIHSMDDLIKKARASTQSLSVGTYTAGYQLAMEWLSSMAKVKFLSVPYSGGVQMFADVLGRQVDFAISDVVGATPLIEAGTLRPLAVSGEARHPDFPDVPTLKESGYPDYVNYVWSSFMVRTETPDEVTRVLSDALEKIFTTEQARKYADTNRTELLPYGPTQMRTFQLSEYERFRKVAEAAGLKPQ